MQRLKQTERSYYITNGTNFIGDQIDPDHINQAMDFAHEMVFGSGFHRNHRTGGQHSRKKGELFCNTFQGKLSEIILHNYLKKERIDVGTLDFGIHGQGVWDDADLTVHRKHLSIKSVAFFSNLLLLETKDLDLQGNYIPNLEYNDIAKYDYFILIRIKPDLKGIFRKNRLFYSNDIDKSKIVNLVNGQNWQFDIPGYIDHYQLLKMMDGRYILPQNAFLNGKIKMDAENYYVQTGDMNTIGNLVKSLKQL